MLSGFTTAFRMRAACMLALVYGLCVLAPAMAFAFGDPPAPSTASPKITTPSRPHTPIMTMAAKVTCTRAGPTTSTPSMRRRRRVATEVLRHRLPERPARRLLRPCQCAGRAGNPSCAAPGFRRRPRGPPPLPTSDFPPVAVTHARRLPCSRACPHHSTVEGVMSAPIRTGPVAGNPAQVPRPFPWIRSLAALALSVLASGCAGAPATPFAGVDPADPAAPAA